MNNLLIIILLLNFSCKSFNQEETQSTLDAFLNTLEDHHLANGNIAISNHGRLEYQNELGFAYKEEGKEIFTTRVTRYRIGSVSKMFTATIIFQLIEEKRLQLDNTLSDFIPDIPNANTITIESLLRHRSGLVNYTDDPEFDQWKYKQMSSEELSQVITKATPKFPPDSQFDYSNTNYFLLSLLIEQICKKSFQEVLTEQILSKINLQDTYFEVTQDTILRNSKSYKYINSQWIQQAQSVASNHLGAGALVSTSTDLVTFMDALFSHKLLSPQSLETMTMFIDDDGIGVFRISYNDVDTAFGHEGRIDEFYTSLIHYPTEKITIAYCTNGILYPRDDIMKTVTDICLNRTTTLPDFDGIKSSPHNLNQLVGTYSSSSLQISVGCKHLNDRLVFTTQGQDFETTQIAENAFANLQFGYFFEFLPNEKQLIIKETDNRYVLGRETD